MEEQEIYLLITRYLSNQTTTAENEQLADWIAESTNNENTFEEIKLIWQAANKNNDTSVSSALSKLKNKIKAEDDKQASKHRIIKLNRYAVAASISASFLAVCFMLYRYVGKTNPPMLTAVTAVAEKKTIVLDDGTRICLAPQSKLIYPQKFQDDKRTVELQGQAYFEVSKNPHRPFVVHTAKLDVQVLGTHFNINGYKNQEQTKVSLLEGKVKVSVPDDNAANEYILEPGEEIALNNTNHQIYQYKLDSTAAKGWMTNTLVFKDEKLIDAVKRIEQMYGLKIVFADQETADTRLYVTFKNEPLQNILVTLAAVANVEYKIEGNKVYLSLNQKNQKY